MSRVFTGMCIVAAIAVVALALANNAHALPNQDDNNLCNTGNVAFQHRHQSDCAGTIYPGGEHGHDTANTLPQTAYPLQMPNPLAMPSLSAPKPPDMSVCGDPSTKPRC